MQTSVNEAACLQVWENVEACSHVGKGGEVSPHALANEEEFSHVWQDGEFWANEEVCSHVYVQISSGDDGGLYHVEDGEDVEIWENGGILENEGNR